MPHHFTKATVQAKVFCPTCNKQTMHYVWNGRLGRCMNDHPHTEKKPDKPVDQGKLFNG